MRRYAIYLDFVDPTPVVHDYPEGDCRRGHTPCPDDYCSWHEWAEMMGETHEQVRCEICGLWAVWVPRS